MNEELQTAIKALSQKSKNSEKADDAMKYAQAAFNLAHTVATLKGADMLVRSDA